MLFWVFDHSFLDADYTKKKSKQVWRKQYNEANDSLLTTLDHLFHVQQLLNTKQS